MGLDQYAYVAARAGQQDEFYKTSKYIEDTDEWVSEIPKPREIAYWRKHPNLQGWMQLLWERRGNSGDFNGDELELTWDDLDQLEQDIRDGTVAELGTRGFFFGDASDDYYREHDLDFIRKARAELFMGLKVFYNSSW